LPARQIGEQVFRLRIVGGALTAEVARTQNGVAVSHDAVPLAQWARSTSRPTLSPVAAGKVTCSAVFRSPCHRTTKEHRDDRVRSDADAADATACGGDARRLLHLRLSTDEFTMLGHAGFQPVGMVVGSSIYQIGRWSQSQELEVLSRAMYEAREFALTRMLTGAHALDADGVVGTDLTMQMYVGAQDVCELVSVGTAIRYTAAPGSLRAANGMPFSSHLSGQSIVKLWHAGYVPVHFEMGICVHHVAHRKMLQSMRQIGQNVEMPQYTQAVYEAREIALERMQTEARTYGAAGIVGSSVTVANHVWGEHAIEFMALGTAVKPHVQTVQLLPVPAPVVSFDR
jgi:uncharacterized protein YbjQ (UPF0145 family)